MDINNLVLRPNCLMTKYPIVFVTGLRSLFFHDKLASELQDYIAAHGYIVLSPPMPFKNKNHRKFILEKWLQQQKEEQFHFILGEQTFGEFSEIFKNFPESTFTIAPHDFKKNLQKKISTPLSYRLHSLYLMCLGSTAEPYEQTLPDKSTEFYDGFLDHCIELAENESI
ncbi:hypothetical protein K2P97_11930 [bacterium]|nr:hypothetical protein [bacterium]